MDSGHLTLDGANLESVESIRITGNGQNKLFTIISQSASQIKAAISSSPALDIVAGFSYNLLIEAANAQSIIPISFSISDNSITSAKIQNAAVTSAKLGSKSVTYEKIDTTGASNGQVLTFNSTTGKWGPANASGSGFGGVSSLTPGNGIVFDSVDMIKTSGKISVDVGTGPEQILQFDSENSVRVSQGSMTMLTDVDTVDKGSLRFLYYSDDTDDDVFDSSNDTIVNEVLWKFDSNGNLVMQGSGSGAGEVNLLTFDKYGSGSGMRVDSNFSVTGTSFFEDDAEFDAAVDANDDLNVDGTFTNPSDERLKVLIKPVDDVLEKILGLDVWRYRYKKGNALGITYEDEKVGVVAQKLKAVLPQAVDADKLGYFYVKQDAMIYYLLKALQESENHRRDNKEKFQLMHDGQDQRLAILEREVQELKLQNRTLRDYLCKKDPPHFCD
jgi:hypothetical protein